jgi:ABC-type sugar transport system ATPase subunit
MSLLNVSGISKKEGEDYLLKNINLVQEASEKIAIAGATGSGKTTLLKIIAGLIQPDAGEVLFEGLRVKGPREKLLAGNPHIQYLSQNFELRNNYRVEELLQMANKLSDNDASLIYEVCRIEHLLNRWSDEVSGGERQRIAFAKTLVTFPKLLLLDEPFSNLDAIHRGILKSVIDDIGERLNITCVLVSHDPADLLSWADQIIILDKGKVIQKADPEEAYNNPVNEYAAALFGKYNVISGELIQRFPSLANQVRRFIRPGEFIISLDPNAGIKGTIKTAAFMGSYYEAEIDISSHTITVNTPLNLTEGDTVYISEPRTSNF